MAKPKRVHYVDNKKLLQAMIEWKEFCVLEEKKGGMLILVRKSVFGPSKM